MIQLLSCNINIFSIVLTEFSKRIYLQISSVSRQCVGYFTEYTNIVIVSLRNRKCGNVPVNIYIISCRLYNDHSPLSHCPPYYYIKIITNLDLSQNDSNSCTFGHIEIILSLIEFRIIIIDVCYVHNYCLIGWIFFTGVCFCCNNLMKRMQVLTP